MHAIFTRGVMEPTLASRPHEVQGAVGSIGQEDDDRASSALCSHTSAGTTHIQHSACSMHTKRRKRPPGSSHPPRAWTAPLPTPIPLQAND